MNRKWIFLCYRRHDSSIPANRLFQLLNAGYPDQVFQDVESIDIGVDWADRLRESLLSADVLVVVIGPEWQTMATKRGLRINDPADYVHIEVTTALKHDIRIIPVLLEGAQLPQSGVLHPDLEALLRRQAFNLHDNTFESDIARLTARLERIREAAEQIRATAELHDAARMQQELVARRLSAYAESTAVKPKGLLLAGLLAMESTIRFHLPGAHSVLRQACAGLPRCDARLSHVSEVTAAVESSNGTWIATGSKDGVVKL